MTEVSAVCSLSLLLACLTQACHCDWKLIVVNPVASVVSNIQINVSVSEDEFATRPPKD